jgi:hypothetical protein
MLILHKTNSSKFALKEQEHLGKSCELQDYILSEVFDGDKYLCKFVLSLY